MAHPLCLWLGGIDDLDRDEAGSGRCRQLLLPATQNAAGDSIPAGDLCDACVWLCRTVEDAVFTRFAEPAPMAISGRWNKGAFGYWPGISHMT